MKNTLETRLGLFVALVVLAAFLIINTVGGLDKFRRGLHIRALFDTAQELKVGDRVKMAGVEVGRVEEISITNNKVMVTMKLKPDPGVKTDSSASIKFAGLMGQSFVSIAFGKLDSPPATDGFIIPSTEQADISAIMTKLDNVASGVENLTKSFSGDKIDNLLGPFTDFLKQNSGNLSRSISNMNHVTSQIASGQGTVGKLIYDDALYTTALTTVSNLQSTSDEIKATIAEARKVVDGVNAGEGTLGKLVKDEKLYAETTASMTNLREILEKVNKGDGTVGKLINEQDFYKNAKLTLQKVDKATESLEDQGPLSIIGILGSSLF